MPPSPYTPRPVSDLTLGPFKIDAPIGEGAMGEVWKGRHDTTGQLAAVKILTRKYARHGHFRDAFRNEVRAVATLDHPNIVSILGHGEVTDAEAARSDGTFMSGTPWYGMEFVDGSDLAGWKGQLDWPQQKQMLLSLLKALAHAHARGLVHRDIKPGNLLWDGETDGLRLVDFGLSHLLGRDRAEHDELLVGTPVYMAPEQFREAFWALGPWTDLYAVGCVAWAMATGGAPYSGEGTFERFRQAHLTAPLPPFRPAHAVPPALFDFLARLLAKRPDDRFQRAADAIFVLEGLETAIVDPVGFDPLQLPTPVTWRLERNERPRPRALGLGLAGLRTLPLVGREQERRVLWDALSRVRAQGRPEVVLLEGPAGVGKTRLASWLGERADELGLATVVQATHSPGPAARSGLGGLVSRFLRLGGLGRVDVERALEERLGALGVADRDALEDLAELVSPQDADTGVMGRFGPVLRLKAPHERFELVRRFMDSVSGRRLPILIVDDAQWATETLELVQNLLEPSMGPPFPALVILTARPEAMEERSLATDTLRALASRREVSRVVVGALAPAESSELLRHTLGLGSKLARTVETATEGMPQFAVQLVEDWLEQGLLIETDAGFALKEQVTLPASLAQLWSGRLDRLLGGRPRADTLALELAAVLGVEVDGGEWKDLCAMAGMQPPWEMIDLLLAQRLAWCEGGDPRRAWGFVHVLLRDQLLARGHEAGRLELQHRACARMLAQKPGPLAAERRGRHLLASGTATDLEASLEPLHQGADARMQRGEYRYADWLLDLRDDAMTKRGLAGDDPRWGDGWIGRVYSGRMRGQFDEARDWLTRCEPFVGRPGWERIAVHVDRERGLDALLRGDGLSAWRHLRSAEQQAQELWDAQLLVDCQRSLGYALRVRGDLDQAEEVFRQALHACLESGDAVGAANCRIGLGRTWVHGSRYAEGEVVFRQAAETYAAHNMRWEQASTLNDLGDTLRGQDKLPEAERCYRQARERLLAIGASHAVYPVANLGQMLAQQARWAEAREILESALSIFDRQGLAPMQGTLHALLLAPVIADGDGPGFDLHLSSARTLLDETGYIDPDVANMARLAGDVARGIGEESRARSAYQLSAHQLRALGREDEARHVEVVFDLLDDFEPPVQDDWE
jgi:eukaryotic-like serine/threonine-protein kinase